MTFNHNRKISKLILFNFENEYKFNNKGVLFCGPFDRSKFKHRIRIKREFWVYN